MIDAPYRLVSLLVVMTWSLDANSALSFKKSDLYG
jgi:hypothetical protein